MSEFTLNEENVDTILYDDAYVVTQDGSYKSFS